ncbi:centrosomal protein of 170 kDa protein B isoform X2 [Amblyraja radiata]|uniref:centrosomal protein of 170 kDa protein B isoform X2 n=1 Tax=Amblyraja radiata TaxID=386614 RepID=UPI0014028792|nr:centrosomal protein of 170 kDa protein B isoform X2 [Amblyraja radiata]
MSVTSWFLVSSCGSRHRLPKEMIFVGREDCELMLQSRSVDKQHAVINYETATDEHRVKDLGSLNGTFVNDVRIPDQMYVTLKVNDTVRFGYDSNMYMLEKSTHIVPEEALKHEKYTSQFQIQVKAAEDKKAEQSDMGQEQSSTKLESPQQNLEKTEKKESATIRPTPLYGQPSWWGDDDVDNKGGRSELKKTDSSKDNSKETSRNEQEINGNHTDYKDFEEKSVYSFRREPSYFEIPTKEFQQPSKSPDCEVHEIPTKDTDTIPSPRIQSHASFTIEFDDDTPGKMKIKDHVTKFPSRPRKAQQIEKVPVQGDVLSAENKVVDWLVQNDPSLMLKRQASRDIYIAKSDYQVQTKALKGYRHEDGTQSDSENQIVSQQQDKGDSPLDSPPEQMTSYSDSKMCQLQHDQQDMPVGQQAFVIEFFDDDNPRKRRAHSFTQNASAMHNDSYIALRAKLEKRKGTSTCEKVAVQQAQSLVQTNKSTASSSLPQRSNSLKREKTEERLGASATSSFKGSLRSFGSVGRKSKLSQEFAAELLKETAKSVKVEKTDPVPVTVAHVPVAAPLPETPVSAPTTSTKATLKLIDSAKPISKQGDQDSLSDTGTYTIETDAQDKEVEEARKMIDKVFGVFESSDFSGISSEIYRPVICDEDSPTLRDEDNVCNQNASTIYQQTPTLQAYRTTAITGSDTVPQARPVGPIYPASQKWVSRWASLADGYNGTVPVTGFQDLQGKDAATVDIGTYSKSIETLDSDATSTTSQSSRKRRTLPQLPPSEKLDIPKAKDFLQQRSPPSSESIKKLEMDLRSFPQPHERLFIREDKDLEPDSLSDDDKPDDSSHVVKGKGRKYRISRAIRKLHQDQTWNDQGTSEEGPLVTDAYTQCTAKELSDSSGTKCVSEHNLKSASYSTKEKMLESPSNQTSVAKVILTNFEKKTKERDFSSKSSTVSSSTRSGLDINKTVMESIDTISSTSKTTRINNRSPSQERKKMSTRDSRVSVIRQESFTKDRPSIDTATYKVPTISSQMSVKDHTRSSHRTESTEDTHLFLKDTEDAMAALEAKLQSQDFHFSQQESNSHVQGDSFSGESDNDTTSSVSLKSKNTTSSVQKQKNVTGAHKGKTATSVQGHPQQANARERLSEKRQAQVLDSTNKSDSSRRFQLKRSTGSRGSTDFTDDERSTSLPYVPTTDTVSSDQEHSQTSKSQMRKRFSGSLRTKEDLNKTAKASVQTTLTRSNSLSTPRPTRASLLRRARLGDTSDNEGADVDKSSLASELSTASSTSSKQPTDKKLSRLDMLALPRKRAGSFTVNSDTETSVLRSSFSMKSVDLTATSRKSTSTDSKTASRKTTTNTVKQTRGRGNGTKSASNSRWRQQTSDYTSTSEEEYNSNHTSPKHNRLHASTATHSSRAQSSNSGRTRQNVNDVDDPYENWTTHSAEIARLSQDLAKDLAILAREIHDVAGDGDSLSSLPTTSTLGSTISAREELVQHIPEASLNFQKVPPESSGIRKNLDQNMNDSKDPDSKRRSWNREEVILDNLMWNSVSQLSQYIRENMEQTAAKIKILFQNKDRNWEEIEAKMNSEDEVPILKTSNKEISSIFKDLRRVQKQLDVINTIIDPDGSLDALTTNQMSPTSASSMKIKERTGNTMISPNDLPKSTTRMLMAYAHQGPKLSQMSSDADSIDSDSECNTQYTIVEPNMEDTITML